MAEDPKAFCCWGKNENKKKIHKTQNSELTLFSSRSSSAAVIIREA
jgi:hypothetical protein